jgi:hypothetical protein
VYVDAVEHGAREVLLVFGHHGLGAGAGFLAVAVVAAWAGMHTSNKFFV